MSFSGFLPFINRQCINTQVTQLRVLQRMVMSMNVYNNAMTMARLYQSLFISRGKLALQYNVVSMPGVSDRFALPARLCLSYCLTHSI
jgi:hypothetical protein